MVGGTVRDCNDGGWAKDGNGEGGAVRDGNGLKGRG